jgi:hypothetical protein
VGYGREYRYLLYNTTKQQHNITHQITTHIVCLTIFDCCSEELNGHWGEFDVDDAVYAAQHLIRSRVLFLALCPSQFLNFKFDRQCFFVNFYDLFGCDESWQIQ